MEIVDKSLLYKPLPKPWNKKAEKEIRETPERASEALVLLRNKIEAHGGFRCSTSSEYLLRFLRVGKFDVDRAFRTLKKLLRSHATYPEFFIQTTLDEVTHVMVQNIGIVLLDKTADGALIGILKNDHWDSELCGVNDNLKAFMACIEFAMSTDPIMQAFGFVLIIDFQDFTFKKLRHFTPSFLYKMFRVVQESMAARFRQVHVVNENIVVDVGYKIIYPLLSNKLRNRIHFHGKSMSSLHKYISPSVLPEEYEGLKGPVDYKPFWDIVKENEELTVELCNYSYKSRKDAEE